MCEKRLDRRCIAGTIDEGHGPGQAFELEIVPSGKRGRVRVVGNPEADGLQNLRRPKGRLVQVEESGGAFWENPGLRWWVKKVILHRVSVRVRLTYLNGTFVKFGEVTVVRRYELRGVERRDNVSWSAVLLQMELEEPCQVACKER